MKKNKKFSFRRYETNSKDPRMELYVLGLLLFVYQRWRSDNNEMTLSVGPFVWFCGSFKIQGVWHSREGFLFRLQWPIRRVSYAERIKKKDAKNDP